MPSENLAAARVHLQALVNTYRENFAQYQRATYNETIRVQNMVHYSPEEYAFYKSNQSGYVTAGTETLDKYYLFIEKALSLLKDDGILGYIVPHKFMNIKSGAELRGLLSSHGNVRKIIHFGTHQVFENRSTYTCILIMSKQPNTEFEIGFVQDLNRFLFEHDAPVNLGEGKYVDVSGDNEKLVESFKKLLEHSGDTARLLLENGILSENVLLAASTIRKQTALSFFEKSLEKETSESFWQDWFSQNKWVLGSDFAKIIDERNIDTKNIADYLMCAFDGFVDIVEIKKPNGLPFWATTKDHDNYVPSTALIKAITQCQNYLYAIERRCNDADFREATKSKVIKPRCILIYGRSNDWDNGQREAYRILNSSYTQISILTYDHLLARAKNVLGVMELDNEEEIPF